MLLMALAIIMCIHIVMCMQVTVKVNLAWWILHLTIFVCVCMTL
jgi:hypothetical protein